MSQLLAVLDSISGSVCIEFLNFKTSCFCLSLGCV